jgi:hypothetical protein
MLRDNMSHLCYRRQVNKILRKLAAFTTLMTTPARMTTQRQMTNPDYIVKDDNFNENR